MGPSRKYSANALVPKVARFLIRRHHWAPAMALAPFIILLLVLFAWPIAGVIGDSFGEDELFLATYKKAMSSAVYRQIF